MIITGLQLPPSNITCTSYETYESLMVAYTDAAYNIAELKKYGVNVFHEIDAAKINTFSQLGKY